MILFGSRKAVAEQVPHPLRRSRLAGPAPGIRDVVRGSFVLAERKSMATRAGL